MRRPLPGMARLTLALAAAALPALAQQPSSPTPVRKDVPATTTSRGEIARDTAAAAARPSPSAMTTMDPSTTALVSSVQSEAHAMGLLHAANMAEIDEANLAQQRATDADVKAFAARMVTDHTALDQQGAALGTQLGITAMLPDSTLPRMESDAMARISGTNAPTGADFDRAYIAQQVADHQRVLAIIDAALARTQRAELRTALQTQVRPKVAEHLQMAQQLQQKLGGR